MPVSPYIRRMRRHIGHEELLLHGASAVLRNDDGELLLGRRSDDGTWALVSGMVDPGEQPADALLREILEETGVHAEIERLAGVASEPYTYPNGDVCRYLNVWFLCRAVGGKARVNDNESLEVAWFRPDALPDLDAFALLRIETALSGAGPAWFAPPGETPDALR